LKDFEYYRWVGRPEDDEEDMSSSSDADELFDFALLRFRRLPHFSDAPVGIVKLQALKTDSAPKGRRQSSPPGEIPSPAKSEKNVFRTLSYFRGGEGS